MKWKLFAGALIISAGFCTQGYSYGLLDRMLGGCGGCDSCCEPACCEPACCEPAVACCDQEPSCCEPAAACCDPCNDCCDPCDSCCKKKRCGLFGRLRGLFDCCKSSCDSCCESACEPACCEPAVACCDHEPSCCEPAACDSCDSCDSCCKKKRRTLLDILGCRRRCRKSCCHTSCGGCSSCGGGAADSGDASDDSAPVPPAPMADPSASIQTGKGRIVKAKATRSVVRR